MSLDIHRERTLAERSFRDTFAEFLKLDVANGDARADTVRTYWTHVNQWVNWCRQRDLNPAEVGQHDVKAYRQFLVEQDMKHSTIALKLTIIRRFYQAAVERGLIEANPVQDVKAPRERKAQEESMKHLSAGELELLLRAVPRDQRLKSLRDRVLIVVMSLEGLRDIEVVRANVEDIEEQAGGGLRILVHGKGKEGYIYPREDTVVVLKAYLQARGTVDADEQGIPLFTSTGNRAGGRRITRDGVRDVIDFYLMKADLKRPGLSCHGLRHTCGALLYQATRDVKAVQETLRHADISTAARYSHIVERNEARYTRAIPVKAI